MDPVQRVRKLRKIRQCLDLKALGPLLLAGLWCLVDKEFHNKSSNRLHAYT